MSFPALSSPPRGPRGAPGSLSGSPGGGTPTLPELAGASPPGSPAWRDRIAFRASGDALRRRHVKVHANALIDFIATTRRHGGPVTPAAMADLCAVVGQDNAWPVPQKKTRLWTMNAAPTP